MRSIDGAWARIATMAQKMPVLPAGRRALREAEPWSQAFLGTVARPRPHWLAALPSPLSLAPPAFPAALAGGPPAPREPGELESQVSAARGHVVLLRWLLN